MRVALIDVDGHNFPNLPLMKLSAWHKRKDDSVEWYDPLTAWITPPDKVYMSKVFTFTPDYPWIELLWENEIKTRSNRVKFVFNYMNKSYCLIQYYYSNVLIGMERMNYDIEYIVNHRNDDTMQNE